MSKDRSLVHSLFAFILTAGLAASACDVQLTEGEYVEASETELAWTPEMTILVRDSRGALEVRRGEGDRILIKARKSVVAPSNQEERELAKEIRVEAVRQAGGLEIDVSYPDGKLSNSRLVIVGRDARRPRARVELTLSIPPGAKIRYETRSGDFRSESYSGSLEVSSISGDVYLDDWRGDCSIDTRSGDASILRVQGGLRMSTASGDLTGEEVGGALDFSATSGDLKLSRVEGKLTASTASGDIEVDRVGLGVEIHTTSGDVAIGTARAAGNLETSGGDVEIGLRDPDGRFDLRTASGDATVTLAPPFGGRLEVFTASGTIDVMVPVQVEEANRNRLAGRLGAGGQLLRLSTASGDVQVNESHRGGEL